MYPSFEPRSDNYSYDDDEYTGSVPAWDWKFLLYLPIVVVIMLLVSLAPFLMLLVYFLHDLYSTLKKTANTGELSYPFLVKTGIVLSVILVLFWPIHIPHAFLQPNTFLILSIGFILIFTILPLLMLCLHRLRILLHR